MGSIIVVCLPVVSAISGTKVIVGIIDFSKLQVFEFNGLDWVEVSLKYEFSSLSVGDPAIASMGDSVYAFVDGNASRLGW